MFQLCLHRREKAEFLSMIDKAIKDKIIVFFCSSQQFVWYRANTSPSDNGKYKVTNKDGLKFLRTLQGML